MQHHHRQQHQLPTSSPSLSSPPSVLSDPGSPSRFHHAGRANIEMDEIIVDPSSVSRFAIMQQHHQQQDPAPDVLLTAAGLPRKKPGRKPGSTVKPKPPADGTAPAAAAADQPKQRRPRKPKDPNAPPAPRKRKAAAVDATDTASEAESRSVSGPPRPEKVEKAEKIELTPMRMDLDPRPSSSSLDIGFTPPAPKRETASGSMNMRNLLNDDPQPKPQPKPEPAPTRQIFDPVRGNYDPIRDGFANRDSYSSNPLASPRAPTQVVNRASASPSIASLVDPQPTATVVSPRSSFTNPRYESAAPTSPSQTPRTSNPPPPPPPPPKTATTATETRRAPAPPPAPAPTSKPEPKTSSFTSMTSTPTMSGANPAAQTSSAPAPPQSKKLAAVVQQERESTKKARSTSSASPRISSLRDTLPPLPGGERSILDFGKARPGEEQEAPSITLRIPLAPGECNKYVNFMRMAEERYGWDALHPRLAASRERKARIAAATAALERSGSGRDSGEDMDEDILLHGSDAGESNVEPTKPARKKKRNFKEDEYDKDDDFVDDSELLWEEQAAASRDGFFVYSGPLIPEVEKPPPSEERPRRGRGGRGRGSRGGGGGTSRGGSAAAAAAENGTTERGSGSGRGRGGGPGSRGGGVRKPRGAKGDKEKLAAALAAGKADKMVVDSTPSSSSVSGSGGLLGLGGSTPAAAAGAGMVA